MKKNITTFIMALALLCPMTISASASANDEATKRAARQALQELDQKRDTKKQEALLKELQEKQLQHERSRADSARQERAQRRAENLERRKRCAEARSGRTLGKGLLGGITAIAGADKLGATVTESVGGAVLDSNVEGECY